jgi:hypothetical protein
MRRLSRLPRRNIESSSLTLTLDPRKQQRPAEIKTIHLDVLIRFTYTMKKNLIALTFLGLFAIFLAGCTATTETTTTTARTREQSSMYAR